MSLQVRADGTLTRRGKPYRGLGVNYVDCLWRVLADPSATTCRAGFETLAERKIPFARFAAGGYWPSDWTLYRRDPAEHFRRFDGVVRAAEAAGVGLIPSLFWHYATVPDLLGEPARAWGEPASKTRGFVRRYTREVVTRYRRSGAIWAWEMGNEFNLPADLPNAAAHRPPVVVEKGTPAARSADDEVTHAIVRSAVRAFAAEVRRHDRTRPVSAGHAFPRPSAWHQQRERSWRGDSPVQFRQTLRDDSPDPADLLGGHLYAEEGDRFGAPFSAPALLREAMAASRRARKPLFVGEFGVPGARSEDAYSAMLEAIVAAGVPLAALWVFDFGAQDADWNVTAGNARAGQLDRIAAANRSLR